MTAVRTVAVAGLGVIGGSAARALSARGVRVLGQDADAASVRAAMDAGVVARALGDDFEGLEDADALLIAVPVRAAAEVLARAAPRARSLALITDAGSTKASIVAAAERLGVGDRFVGAHPLAGSHESGWAAARAELFAGATVYLTPAAGSSDDALSSARELWTMVGGRLVVIDAAAHDRRLAWTSHLPQLVSSALGLALADASIGRADLGPGGRDVTRLAASSPAMWTDIALDNAAAIAPALAAIERRIAELRAAVQSADEAAVRELFASARAWAEP